MNTQPMVINLQSIWDQTIEGKKIRSQINDPLTNHKIEVGLTREPGSNRVRFYGLDRTSSTEIAKRVEKRAIVGAAYNIQLNEYRSLRPKAEGSGCPMVCDPTVDPLPEHSLWARDPLFLVALPNSKYFGFANLLPYNEHGAFIIVPCLIEDGRTALPHWPQVLNRARVEDFLALRRVIDNMVLFFNPVRGGASVETHFHFQATAYPGPLAIESAARESRGKYTFLSGLPNGLVFDKGSADSEICAVVERFEAAGIPANVIAVGDVVYIMPRSADSDAYPTGAPASLEMIWEFVTADPKVYDVADRELLDRVLRRATLGVEKTAAVLGI